MKIKSFFFSVLGFLFVFGVKGWALTVPEAALRKAFGANAGAFVLVDCASGETSFSDQEACNEKVAPCSTFKIWNSAIGLETGIVQDPDAPFWKWDGEKREIDGWNQDQTLRSAFAVSCVPAYQALARKIGPDRMRDWLEKIGYGDRNMSAGIDLFWLPHPPDRKTLLISPAEQAALIAKLANGTVPFSKKTLSTLKSVMTLRASSLGILMGKTGTGGDEKGVSVMGWFVGYVDSGGKSFALACLLRGNEVMGKDARSATELILGDLRLL